jgi:hypothetical protein
VWSNREGGRESFWGGGGKQTSSVAKENDLEALLLGIFSYSSLHIGQLRLYSVCSSAVDNHNSCATVSQPHGHKSVKPSQLYVFPTYSSDKRCCGAAQNSEAFVMYAFQMPGEADTC